jgi:2-oxoglutarate dehydrogenase E2 component (dihydrolipoamide succinyltransferase)
MCCPPRTTNSSSAPLARTSKKTLMRGVRIAAGFSRSGVAASLSGMAGPRVGPVFSSGALNSRATPSVLRRCYASEAFTVKLPQLAESLSDGEIAQILVKVGDHVTLDQQLFSIETNKATLPVNAPDIGTVTELLVGVGDKVVTDQPLLKMKLGAAAGTSAGAAAPAASAAPPAEPTKSKSVPPPPGAKSAGGSSAPPPPPPPAAAAAKAAAPAAASAPAPAVAKKPSAASEPPLGPREERRERLSKMRRVIAQRLKDSQNTYAMLTTFQECDMSGLFAIREKYGDAFAKAHSGVKLGFMSAFVKAAATALRESPEVNGVIDGEDVVFRNYVDISIAVASPKGLVVPVIRDADRKSFADIERSISELGEKARNNQIELEDMAGGTFTISNGGVFGSLMGTPIINPPQSAILGMHGINKRPVVITTGGKDTIEIRPMMYLALTYDHRLVDGREGVTFLRRVKQLVEDPARIVIGV